MTRTSRRKLHLGAFLVAPGYHIASWRHPHAHADGGLDFGHYRDLVQTAERGLFDLVFLSDGVGIRIPFRDADELSRQGRLVQFEPVTLLSALAVHTTHIGLAATASTTYNEPFNLARKFASLDHLSGGRSGWNVVTSVTDAEARNFNRDKQPEHAARYHRAREFMEVVTGLWDSWEDDAFLYDKESGRFFDPQKLHILGHQGEHFQVRGPLNVARPPQGYPVIVQAGASDDGQDFAARWAEVVFTAAQNIDQAREFYGRVKERVVGHGRDPEQVKVLPGVFPVVGRTQTEAEDKYAVLQELVDPVVGLGLLKLLLGDVDISGYPVDGPLPELPRTEGSTSRQQLVYDKARREGLTIRELYQSISGGRGHRIVIGTPESLADELEEWFTTGAADGFNIMPAVLPDGLDDFVTLVVPELQRRGLYRTEYEGRTLRENLGLDRPAWGAARARSGAGALRGAAEGEARHDRASAPATDAPTPTAGEPGPHADAPAPAAGEPGPRADAPAPAAGELGPRADAPVPAADAQASLAGAPRPTAASALPGAADSVSGSASESAAGAADSAAAGAVASPSAAGGVAPVVAVVAGRPPVSGPSLVGDAAAPVGESAASAPVAAVVAGQSPASGPSPAGVAAAPGGEAVASAPAAVVVAGQSPASGPSTAGVAAAPGGESAVPATDAAAPLADASATTPVTSH